METSAPSEKVEAMAETSRSAHAAEPDLLALTARIVASHVGNNATDTASLPGLIQEVYRALSTVGQTVAPAVEKRSLSPAVPVKKSVFADYIICLEDGKKLKMLKRHLKTAYNLSPEDYRERWGLAADYPMVAPNYANHRSSLAKKSGLGKAKSTK
jgi:predicted transcriptional regulator